ncbi:hypothetical protein, partial [Herbiconiux daphne]
VCEVSDTLMLSSTKSFGTTLKLCKKLSHVFLLNNTGTSVNWNVGTVRSDVYVMVIGWVMT